RKGRVRAIARHDKRLERAFAPLSVAIALEDDVDVGRGAVLAHPRNVPRGARSLEAMVVWMHGQPLRAGAGGGWGGGTTTRCARARSTSSSTARAGCGRAAPRWNTASTPTPCTG